MYVAYMVTATTFTKVTFYPPFSVTVKTEAKKSSFSRKKKFDRKKKAVNLFSYLIKISI
jgi:hypothetical protein